MTWMKRRSKFAVMSIATLPLLFHSLVAWQMNSIFAEIGSGKDITLLSIPRHGATDPKALPIQIIATNGDIFQPQLQGIDRAYDLIVLSATVDPFYSIGDIVVWESNLLVRSFFAFSYEDRALIESGIRNLILRMLKNNSAFVQYLLNEPVRQIRYNLDYVAKLCEPFIAKIPKDSLLEKLGIRWYAILPLFNSKSIPIAEDRGEKLALNVKIAVGRLANDLSRLENDYAEYRIRIIAIPALAGSETLVDSKFYLKYADSFMSIVQGLSGTPLPRSLERVYLVAWNKWSQISPDEGRCALSGLKSVYDEFTFPTYFRYVAYLVVVCFGAAYGVFYVEFNRLRRATLKKYFLLIAVLLASQLLNSLRFADWIVQLLGNAYHLGGQWLLVASEASLGALAIALACGSAALLESDWAQRVFK